VTNLIIPCALFSLVPIEFGLTRNTPFDSPTHKPYVVTILDVVKTEIAPFDPLTPKTLPYNQTWSGSDDPLWRYRHSKCSQMRSRSFVGRSSINIFTLMSDPLPCTIPLNPYYATAYLRTRLHIYSGGTEVTVTGTNLDSVAEPSINLIVNITRISNRTASSVISRSKVLW